MLSDNIKKYRKENNMSQDELAEKLGVSRQSISLWENGQTQPTIDNIIALAKIFGISTDAILEDTGKTMPLHEKTITKNKKIILSIISAIITVVVIIGIILFVVFLRGKSNSADSKKDIKSSLNSQSNLDKDQVDAKSSDTQVSKEVLTGNNSSTTSKTKETIGSSLSSGTGKSKENTASEIIPVTNNDDNKFDLFLYCKNFAIQKGKLNGDYSIYQQPATKYGGYQNEYFSISYWGDSDMVEFSLHCPLDETYSINFYLRMRGGYNKKYEYLSSRYYRDSGKSLRSATGYIDPSTFSDNYPLSCNQYDGSFDGQDAFMEESRIGMCDLIRCLKKFVEVEKMECGFSAFDFINF